MSKVRIDIDGEALARGAEVLGTETVEDTVNAALREIARVLPDPPEPAQGLST